MIAKGERKNEKKKGKKIGEGGSRELKRLEWSLKEEEKKCRRGEGSQSIKFNL